MAVVNIPEWAVDRALERFPRPTFYDGSSWKPAVLEGRDAHFANAVRFLAEQIARYEEPPVDPLLLEAREIVKATLTDSHQFCDCRAKIDAGEWDTGQKVRAALAALKRGMELAQKEK